MINNDKIYLFVLEKSEGKHGRDKSQYQRLPFLIQKKKRENGKEKKGGIDCPRYPLRCD
tara:strand:- start:297 stop:473 length:177 start_codon:yes stop_codon:yes gene_type:complete